VGFGLGLMVVGKSAGLQTSFRLSAINTSSQVA